MTQTTTIRAGESAKTIPLTEGMGLVLTGSSDAVGIAYLLDPILGGTNSTQSWAVGPGDLAQIGPYEDQQKILISCSVGRILAKVRDGVIGGGIGGGPVTLIGAVTGSGSGTVATSLDPASLDAAALALGFQHGAGSAETYTSLGTSQVMTSLTPTAGATTAFAVATCNAMLIRNTEGVDIEFQINGAGVFSTIRADEERVIFGITDASQVAFRRTDYSVATTTGTAATSQITYVTAELLNVSASYTVSRQKVTTLSNGTYQVLGAAACAAVEITNTGIADVSVKISGGISIRLLRNKSTIFNVANANLISVNGAGAYATANPVVTVEVEVFNRVPGLPRRNFVQAVSALGPMKQRFGTNNWSTGFDPDFVMMSSFMPFTRFNPHGKTVSVFNVAANVAVLAGSIGATVADVALLGATETTTVNAQNAAFGSRTAVRVTTTNSGSNIIGSLLNNGAGVDTTNCDIHGVIKSLGSNNPTAMVWELFSTADGSGSDYHSLNVFPDPNGGGMVPPASYGARAFSAHRFTAVGAGADMTSIKYIRFRYTSLVGAILQPERFMVVKKAADRASFIFTGDDGYAYSMNRCALALSPYGWPAVAYLSPVATSFGGNLTGGTLTQDNCRALQNAHGWQITLENYNQESAKQLTAREWRENQLQGQMSLVAIGIDPEGLRDGAIDGAGPATTSGQHYREMPSVLATSRLFKNGPSSVGALFSGYIVGTILTITTMTSGSIASNSVLVGLGVNASQTVLSLASGTANTVGATYNVSVAETVGSVGAPVAMCSDNIGPFAFGECNPPGDPYSLGCYNWDGSQSSANDLQIFARVRQYLEQAIADKGIAILATHSGWQAYYNAMVTYILPWIAVQEAANLARVTTMKDTRVKQNRAAIA